MDTSHDNVNVSADDMLNEKLAAELDFVPERKSWFRYVCKIGTGVTGYDA